MSQGNPILIENLTLTLKKKLILDSVSLQAEKGKITGIIGSSGSGKTTIFKCLLNLNLPKDAKMEGKILIFGKKPKDIPRRLVQPVFQDTISFFNHGWNLRKCLQEPLKINFKLSKEEINFRIETILKEFSIKEKALEQPINRFSGGELQRLSIIRALLCEPQIILMDEPVSALDVIIQEEVIEIIKRINIEKGITILFISHDIDVVSVLCQNVYVMNEGKIVEYGEITKILDKPENTYTKELIDSRNLTDIKY
ncbi:MAG: ATP-binding cassette domain-containing protein [Leptospiraceae bacterium]|nr:ATP-binding cassette domain-containing protein [Leptospiraceae bacterium]